MKVIYEARSRAAEFAPLAASLYYGCPHWCRYCFGPNTVKEKKEDFHNHPRPRKDILKHLNKDTKKFMGDDREILMSFPTDPYQPMEMVLCLTRWAIETFIENDLSFSILTKGGTRALRDFDLLEAYDKGRFAQTIVFTNQADADEWEPHAPPLADRIVALKEAHHRGIKTWISLEPVIIPEQALELIRMLHPFVGHWKVGKLNYHKPPKPVDWIKFRQDVTNLLDSLGADYYLKKSLTELNV